MATHRPDPARRNERSRQAILRVAYELCVELGYDKLTIEAIAARAGVGKQTIYRWWPSKGAVALEALGQVVGGKIDFPDTGDLRADLRQQMSNLAEGFTTQGFMPLYVGLIAAAQSDPVLSRALLDTALRPQLAACRRRLEAAQQRKQLRDDVDLQIVIEMLYGPLYYRLLLRTQPPSAAQVEAVLDLAFAGLAPQPRARKARPRLIRKLG